MVVVFHYSFCCVCTRARHFVSATAHAHSIRIRHLTALWKGACVSFSENSLLVERLLSMQEARVHAERAAEAVQAVRSGRMAFRAAAKVISISVGSLQECVSGKREHSW